MIMIFDKFTTIQISMSNKEKLNKFKLSERESYNSILNDLIKLGEENDLKNIRIKNLESTQNK